MALLQYLDKFDPNKLVVNRPTITSLEKVSRRIERQAEGLDEKDIEPSKDILEEVVSQLRNKNELSRKSLKLMAAGGLDYFKSLPDGDFLLQRFLNAVLDAGSTLVFKSLLLGYLRISQEDHPIVFKIIRKFLQNNIDHLPERWILKIKKYDLLGEDVGAKLADQLLNNVSSEIFDVLEDSGIRRGILISGGFSQAVFKKLCLEISKGHTAENLTRFFDLLDEGSQTEPELPFANSQSGDIASITFALLNPYIELTPDDGVKDRIENFLLGRFEDPRINARRWNRVDERYRAVLSRWLTRRSFELIMDVLSSSNDTHQWAARSKFWGYYIDNNHVSDAWVAFGPDAYYQANILVNNGTIKSRGAFAQLDSSNIQPIHSVIFMKIGDLIISEWTHDGKVRFYKSGNSKAPKLYANRYSPNAIRNDSGPDFAKSHLGYWQIDIDNYIYRYTGIKRSSNKSDQLAKNPDHQKLAVGQSTCRSCGIITQARWLTPYGECLSCVGSKVRKR